MLWIGAIFGALFGWIGILVAALFWAIIKTNGDVLYFVRETKSDTDPRTKRDSERSKFLSGIAHFRAIHVDFDWTNSAKNLQPNTK